MTLEIKLSDIGIFADVFWKSAGNCRVFAFHGSLGAGKTTMINALCHAKGVSDVITSPTFSIVNEYRYEEQGVSHSIFHMDLYRLEDTEETVQAGVEDLLFSGAICFVEWPEKAPGLFLQDTMHIYIEVIDEITRLVTLQAPN